MNEKELNLMDEALSGKRRVKLFDIDRLEILCALSGNELKVWFLHWCYERAGRESWLSLSTIMAALDLTKPTVIAAHKRLEETGWLVPTGQFAASKHSKPTRGSYQIKVYRVDDPISKESLPAKGGSGKESLPEDQSGKKFCGKKSLPKVYGSRSGSKSVPFCSDISEQMNLPSEGTKNKTKTSKPQRRVVPLELEGTSPEKVKARIEWIASSNDPTIPDRELTPFERSFFEDWPTGKEHPDAV